MTARKNHSPALATAEAANSGRPQPASGFVTLVLYSPDGSEFDRIEDFPAIILAAVEKAAKQRRISRDEFFNQAMSAYIARTAEGGAQ